MSSASDATEPVGWDVFLSYSRADTESVVAIQKHLADRGIRTFLDRNQLAAGLPWPEALEHGLTSSQAVAVFLGRGGVGLWQKREIGFALDRQVKFENVRTPYPVIPVLLEGAEVTAGFLFQNTWIDLRDALGRDEGLARLVETIRTGKSVATSELLTDICPYRGLQPFSEAEAGFYFGRELAVTELVTKVLEPKTHFVAVIGASGSGKSSVVAAGLLPRLRKERPPQSTWDVAWLTPGAYPWRRLADALVELLEPEATEGEKVRSAGILATECAAGKGALGSIVERVLRRSNGTQRLLFVVDQFEEILTLAPEAVRQPFVETLLECEALPVTVVLTLRADFFGAVTSLNRGLTDRMASSQVILGPSLDQELRDSIERPAALVRLSFEPVLVDRIVDDMKGRPGSLPLLEFALTELWKRRSGRRLTHEAYKAVGGVERAIATRAEAVFSQLPPEQQATAERLFTRLVRVAASDEEGTHTRYRAKRHEVGEAAWSVAQQFADRAVRLLVTSVDAATREEEVEVSHEALIRGWKRLREWIVHDREFLLWRQDLRFEIAKWERMKRSEAALLRGDLLVKALEWLEKRPDDLNEDERRYVGWTNADDYQIMKVGADAPQFLRFAKTEVVAEYLTVRFLDGHESVIQSDDGKRAGVTLIARIAKAMIAAGHSTRALGLVRSSSDQKLSADLLTELLGRILAQGDEATGMELARELSREIPTDWDGYGAARVLCNTLAIHAAVPLLLELTEPFVYRAQLLTGAITLLVGRNDVERALKLARAMPERSERVTMLMKAAAAMRSGDVAREAFDEACRADPQQWHLQTEALQLVAQLAGGGPALTMSERIRPAQQRATALVSVLPSLASSGAPELSACCTAAAAAVADITEDYIRATARKSLVECLVAAELPDEAYPLAKLEDQAFAPPLLLITAQSFAVAGNEAKAREVAREALSIALSRSPSAVDADLLTKMLPAVIDLTDTRAPIELASSIDDPDARSRYLAVVIGELAKSGHQDQAQTAARAALASAAAIGPEWQQDRAFEHVVAKLVDAGMANTARDLCRGLEQADKRTTALLSLARDLHAKGHKYTVTVLHDSADEARTAPRDHDRRSLLVSVLTTSADLGLKVSATDLWEENLSNVSAVVCEQLARRGNFDAALEFAESVPQRSEETSLDLQAGCYDRIVRVLLETGDSSRAVDVARRGVQCVSHWPTPDAIFSALADGGEFDTLLAVAENWHDRARARELARVSCALSRSDRRDRALAMVREAVEVGRSGLPNDYDSLRVIAQAFLEAGEPHSALELLGTFVRPAGEEPRRRGVLSVLGLVAAPDDGALSTSGVIARIVKGGAAAVLTDVTMGILGALGETALVLESVKDWTGPDKKADGLMRAARFAKGEPRETFVREASAAARLVSDPSSRAEALTKLLPLVSEAKAVASTLGEIFSANPNDLSGAITLFPPMLERFRADPSLDDIVAAVSRGIDAIPSGYTGDLARNNTVRMLAAAGLTSQSIAIARRAGTPATRAEALTTALSAAAGLSESGAARLAQDALTEALTIAEDYRRPAIVAAAIAALAQRAGGSTILDVLTGVSDAETRAACLVAAVTALAARGESTESLTLARQAVTTAGQLSNEYSRRKLIRDVFSAMAAAHMADPLVDIAATLTLEDQVAALAIVAPLPQTPRGVALAREAFDAVLKLEGYQRETLLRDLLAAPGTAGLVSSVLDRVELRGSQVDRAQALAELVGAASRARHPDLALRLAHDGLAAAQLIPTDWERRSLLSKVVSAIAGDDVGRALELMPRITLDSDREDVLGSLASALIASGEAVKGLELIDRISDAGVSAGASIRAFQHFARAGLRSRMRQTAEDALARTHRILEDYQRRSATTTLLQALVEGRFEKAVPELIEAIAHGPRRDEVSACMAKVWAKRGQLDRAIETSMHVTQGDIADPLGEVCEVLLSNGRVNDAVRLVARIPDSHYRRDAIVTQIIDALIEARDLNGAVVVAQSGKGHGSHLSTVAMAIARAGRYSEASQLAGSIADLPAKSQSLTQLARWAAENGDTSNAELTLNEALSVNEEMSDYDERARGAARVAAIHADLRRFPAALAKAESCHLATERVWAYTAILGSHLRGRHPDLAAPLAAVLTSQV